MEIAYDSGSWTDNLGWGLLFSLIILLLPIAIGALRKGVIPIFSSLVLLITYVGFIAIGSGDLGTGGIIISIYILATLGFSAFALISDKKRVSGSLDEEFYDDKIFFKYGQQVSKDIIPIANSKDKEAGKEGWEEEMLNSLEGMLNKRFGEEERFTIDIFSVADLDMRKDSRRFLKISFLSNRGSRFTNFLNVQKVGDQIIVSSLKYVKNSYRWFNVMFYILSSPLHYPLWAYNLIRKKYSADSYLGSFYNSNSFDLLDIESFIKLSNFTVLYSIEEYAKNNGLLTEELKQVIINNFNNTQNIKVSKSKGIRLGKVAIASS